MRFLANVSQNGLAEYNPETCEAVQRPDGSFDVYTLPWYDDASYVRYQGDSDPYDRETSVFDFVNDPTYTCRQCGKHNTTDLYPYDASTYRQCSQCGWSAVDVPYKPAPVYSPAELEEMEEAIPF